MLVSDTTRAIKGPNMHIEIFVTLFTWSMKEKMIWEDIDEAMT